MKNKISLAVIQPIPRDRIAPSATNPRTHFDQARLEELAATIREHGIETPLRVRALPSSGANGLGRATEYEIIAGHRRWRAAELAGLAVLPCIVEKLSDAECRAAQLRDNTQRVNLSALEEGAAYRRDLDARLMSLDELCAAQGKSKSHVCNLMRLAQAKGAVRDGLEQGRIDSSVALLLLRCVPVDFEARAVADVEGLSVSKVKEYLAGTPWVINRRDAEAAENAKGANVCTDPIDPIGPVEAFVRRGQAAQEAVNAELTAKDLAGRAAKTAKDHGPLVKPGEAATFAWEPGIGLSRKVIDARPSIEEALIEEARPAEKTDRPIRPIRPNVTANVSATVNIGRTKESESAISDPAVESSNAGGTLDCETRTEWKGSFFVVRRDGSNTFLSGLGGWLKSPDNAKQFSSEARARECSWMQGSGHTVCEVTQECKITTTLVPRPETEQKVTKATKGKGLVISPEARARIAAAQRQRWAAARAESPQLNAKTAKSAKDRKPLSREARAELAAIARRRWAKAKEGKAEARA